MAAAINALAPTAGAPKAASATPDIFGGMGPDAFLKLLVAQLRYQNPMNPSDPTAMMGQVAQYAQVEALTKMQQGQATEQSLSEARMATDMVGKIISASDGKTNETGKVMSARFTSTGPVLVLDSGAEVTLSAVVTVTDRAVPQVATPAAAPAVTPAASPDPATPDAVAPVAASPDPAPSTSSP
jgi:flagellar basal-body rod modification protein FlgD